jgi:dihydrofolate synthase/folylpolyglutamate synthase
MNYSESVRYLLDLGNEVTAMKLGLTSTEKLLAALGNPERHFLKIQVAGTNGKGSTCAFLDQICRSARIKSGLFTSPHLISITERIKIGGAEIGETDFVRHATRVREASEKLVAEKELATVPTFFEQMTAIGVSAFAEAEIELAILETGLGGRFDSVTATRAEIVAITPIDYDHQQILGNTLPEIAAEKAAIIRADTRVIVAPQKNEAKKVITGKCRAVGVQQVWATEKIQIINQSADFGFPALTGNFTTKNEYYPNVFLGLNGRHQFTNAALAISIAETLREKDYKISTDEIWIGLENAEHKGRLEFYKNFLFDGAHNVAGAKALRDYLDEFVHQPLTIIFGAMRDKDLSEIAEILFPKAERLILTAAKNERAVETSELLKYVPQNYDRKNVTLAATGGEAISTAKKVTEEGELILITGSLYLVGEAQEILKSAF